MRSIQDRVVEIVRDRLTDELESTLRSIRDIVRRLIREDRMDAREDVGPKIDLEPPRDARFYDRRRLDKVLATANASFALNIDEANPASWGHINTRIRGVDGIHWTWEKPFEHNKDFAWCGTEAALCLGAGGLKYDIRHKVMPGCSRLHRFCYAGNAERVIKNHREAQPGDIAIVGTPSAPRGNHITLVLSVDHVKGVINTHEGNAGGIGYDGKRIEGVIRRTRPFVASRKTEYRVMHVYRFLEEDFE